MKAAATFAARPSPQAHFQQAVTGRKVPPQASVREANTRRDPTALETGGRRPLPTQHRDSEAWSARHGHSPSGQSTPAGRQPHWPDASFPGRGGGLPGGTTTGQTDTQTLFTYGLPAEVWGRWASGPSTSPHPQARTAEAQTAARASRGKPRLAQGARRRLQFGRKHEFGGQALSCAETLTSGTTGCQGCTALTFPSDSAQ